ncbi:hypothetical protein SG34_026290 [Thalassomonas viridans]|uniref:Uncharacterized protein n=1 Tax=Thalassomonas viridans TaxID=137584 RepID=A0AAE9Z0W6_9GAMM|nr:hypothetical protein [Thalassomonas viridans]WDE04781.1 hypothetical protein SG34_026290 [Thalassomonas viridans]
MNILEILKLGFIGLAFLLAFFAHGLLSAEQRREVSRPAHLEAISKFMVFSLILGAMSIASPFIPKMLEDKPDPFMEAMLISAKNRKPLPLEFVQEQIQVLTVGHNKRIEVLYSRREAEEKRLKSLSSNSTSSWKDEESLRKIERYIREENREYESKVREFRNML